MCGIAFLRLRKDISYYQEKYGTDFYGLQKLYLLMQKQHNRGQDGAGVINVKLNVPAGEPYIKRYRTVNANPIDDIFGKIYSRNQQKSDAAPDGYEEGDWKYRNLDFMGEVFMGHLRYGTHGENGITRCHPFLRENNWKNKTLSIAGNFNLTNVDALFQDLKNLGQHPKDKVDTVIVLEKIGYYLDRENERLRFLFEDEPNQKDIVSLIEEYIDLKKILSQALKDFDGGYSIVGITGYGASFVARDPNGIRPAYYYIDDEVIVAASEKTAIKTAFNVDFSEIKEIPPAHALLLDKHGNYSIEAFAMPLEKKACSFERIYFSRGSDPSIYQERKELGKLLCPQILKEINYDLENTVFSFIPNTSETAFLGMMTGIEDYLIEQRKRIILEKDYKDQAELNKILSFRPRVEKLVIKDAKLRTFITDDTHRNDLVSHVYDTTYEVIQKKKDTLVIIDDSIVRGTTLEKSILRMLDRLEPRKIIIVSSAPQIRFPDCYGIDMSKMYDFIAFRAVKELLEEHNYEQLIDDVYEECVHALEMNHSPENFVQRLYEPFTEDQISEKIAQLVHTEEIEADVSVIYQTVDNLHRACPNHLGDWYFTGDYPTEGGNQVVNRAFVNYMQGSLARAY